MQQLMDKLVEWMTKQVEQAGAKGIVLGLSGGIDSAVVAGLAKRAYPSSTLGIIMPCHSNPQDAEDAKLAADAFQIPVEKVQLDEVFDSLIQKVSGEPYDVTNKDLCVANIKPRLRMTTLYYYAAKHNYLVAGTGNRSEATIGYFTKYGDGAVDMLPIANLVKKQVRELAQLLSVPQPIIDKPPSAGLWSEQTDECEMGISYEELDQYILTGEADPRVKKIVDEMNQKSEHKRHFPPIPDFAD